MPTLLNKNGFKFFFYANEHEHKHIYILKGDDFAKVELEGLKVKDLKLALNIVAENKNNFIRSWNEWFD